MTEKKKRGYTHSASSIAQRQATAMLRKRVKKDGTPFKDIGNLKKLDSAVTCKRCECRKVCREFVEGDEPNKECPLFYTYKQGVLNVLQNPIIYLAKKVGELDMQIQKQQMLDQQDNLPLNPLTLKAVQVALEATKISLRAKEQMDKRKGSMKVMGSVIDEDEVIDIEFGEEEKEVKDDKK